MFCSTLCSAFLLKVLVARNFLVKFFFSGSFAVDPLTVEMGETLWGLCPSNYPLYVYIDVQQVLFPLICFILLLHLCSLISCLFNLPLQSWIFLDQKQIQLGFSLFFVLVCSPYTYPASNGQCSPICRDSHGMREVFRSYLALQNFTIRGSLCTRL